MLPEKFTERMKALLGKESEALFDAIENGEAVRSFRINRIKTTPDDFEKSGSTIDRKKLDFPPDSYATAEQFPGSLAPHHSGAIYMQDPSAMATVWAVELSEGMTVLDSCSAPGGKTTQLAAAVGESGIVVANEYEAKRCRILQGNVERMGAKNTVVVNLDTAEIAELYPQKFDLVLCDAPCSGEGMFRKNKLAIDEWSEDNVTMCAERQREILSNVAKCVAPQGFLLYSTCTFSLEENEMNVAWFLDSHKDFELVPVSDILSRHTSDGICLDGCGYDMTLTRRFYPHVSHGEGQFIALMRRGFADSDRTEKTDKKSSKKIKKNGSSRPSKQEGEAIRLAKEFLEQNLTNIPPFELILLGSQVYLKPDIELPTHSVFAAGVCVGEVRGNRLVPHHQLFSAYGRDFCLRLELDGNDKRVADYLRGMEISAEGAISSIDGRESGYAALLVDGCALGGVKISSGVAKNHYPKGLKNIH